MQKKSNSDISADDKPFFIHPSASVDTTANIGRNTKVWFYAQIRNDVKIGSNCIIGSYVYIDSGVTIGKNVKIQNAAHIFHGATIEDAVFIGPGVIFTNDKIPRAITPDGKFKTDSDWTVGTITVKYGASIGAGSIILPDVTIGKYAMIGAGAIVTRDVPDYSLVIGCPGKIVGTVNEAGNRQ